MAYTTPIFGPITINKAPSELENGGSAVSTRSVLTDSIFGSIYHKFGFGSDVPGDEIRYSAFDHDGNNLVRGLNMTGQLGGLLPGLFQDFLFDVGSNEIGWLFKASSNWYWTKFNASTGIVTLSPVTVFTAAGNTQPRATLLPNGNIGLMFDIDPAGGCAYLSILPSNGGVLGQITFQPTGETNNYALAVHPTINGVCCLWGEGSIGSTGTQMFYGVCDYNATTSIQPRTNISSTITDHDQEAFDNNSDADFYSGTSGDGFILAWKYRNAAGQRFNGYGRVDMLGSILTPGKQLEEPPFIVAVNNIGTPRIFFDGNNRSILIRDQSSSDSIELATFGSGDINTGANTIDLSSSDPGQIPRDPFSPTNLPAGFGTNGVLPGGLEAPPVGGFWIADHTGVQGGLFKVFTDVNDAFFDTNAVDITSVGSGTHSISGTVLNRFFGYWQLDLDGNRTSDYLDLTDRYLFNQDFRIGQNLRAKAVIRDATGIVVSTSERPFEEIPLPEAVSQNLFSSGTEVSLNTTSVQAMSQPFSLSQEETITRVRTFWRRQGNLTGGLNWSIVEDNGGEPTGATRWSFNCSARIGQTFATDLEAHSRFFDVFPDVVLPIGNYHLLVTSDTDYKSQHTGSLEIRVPTFSGTGFSDYMDFNGAIWASSGTGRTMSFSIFTGQRESFSKNEGKAFINHIRFSDLAVDAREEFTSKFAFDSLQESNKHIGFNLDCRNTFPHENECFVLPNNPELGLFVVATDNASQSGFAYNGSGDRSALVRVLGGSVSLSVANQGLRNKIVSNLAVGGQGIIQPGD